MKKKDDVRQAVIDHEQFVLERETIKGQKYEVTDIVTGEVRPVLAANHYEYNSGIPLAPPVDMPRLSLRERVERLTQAGYDLSSYYHHVPMSDPDDWSEDDDQEPLTPSEAAYVDHIEYMEQQRAAKVQQASQDDGSNPPSDGPSAAAGSSGKDGSPPPPPAPSAPGVALETPKKA